MGEPLGRPGWSARLRAACREGYGWLFVFSVIGAFGLAIKFGAFALMFGSTLLAAAALTVVSTVALTLLAVATILKLLQSS
jgi:hypothetical protein